MTLLQRLGEFARGNAQAPPYYTRKPARWLLDLDAHGTPRGPLTELGTETGPTKCGREITLPHATRTVNVFPYLTADTIEYVFGWVSAHPGDADQVKKTKIDSRHRAFVDLHVRWSSHDPSGPATAIASFYHNGHHNDFPEPEPDTRRDGEKTQRWRRTDMVAIRVDGANAADWPFARTFWAQVAGKQKSGGTQGICLVCGQVGALLRTIPRQIPARLLPNTDKAGALVSVNERTHGFLLQKGLVHAPICEACGLDAMDGLEALLSDPEHSTGARQKQGARLAWWSVGGPHVTSNLLNLPEEHLGEVHRLLGAARQGERVGNAPPDSARFCAVTVSGSSARVMVRDWLDMPLRQIHRNLGHWFDDIEICYGTKTRLHGAGHLALACGRFVPSKKNSDTNLGGRYADFGDKSADRPDRVYTQLLDAAIRRRPLPAGLAKHLVVRVRRDGRIDSARAALSRLFLARQFTSDNDRRPPVALDDTNNEPSHLAGQIFAAYENLQWAAYHPKGKANADGEGLNATFADRHMSGAIINPQRALVAGAHQAQAWRKRLRRDNPGALTNIDKLITDLYARLDVAGGAPATATLPQQHHFILGYYQQKQQRFRAGDSGSKGEDQ